MTAFAGPTRPRPPGPQPREPRHRGDRRPDRRGPHLRPDGQGRLYGPRRSTRRGNVLSERVAIAGTAVNCAGGPTPWGTWLTCEETEDKAGTNGYTKDHGFIFEVDPADPHRTGAVPLTAMGRFQHEAIAVDPKRGIVYETEDAFLKPFGLFYRFLPNRPLGGVGFTARGRPAPGDAGARRAGPLRDPGDRAPRFDGIEWVDVPDPLAAETPVRLQDFGPKGITHAQKLEGCYWGGRCVYFVSVVRAQRARARRPTTSARSGATTRRRAGSPW